MPSDAQRDDRIANLEADIRVMRTQLELGVKQILEKQLEMQSESNRREQLNREQHEHHYVKAEEQGKELVRLQGEFAVTEKAIVKVEKMIEEHEKKHWTWIGWAITICGTAVETLNRVWDWLHHAK